MGIRPLFYRCLLISPSDVAEHREAVARAIDLWNAHSGQTLDARIELIRWEVHGRPDSSGPPQAVLNRQIVKHADLAIALFWSRLGTPTEMAESGSAEEIRLLTARNAQVLIYRCSAAIPQAALHDDQFKLMESFLQEQERHGLIGSYSDSADIYKQVLMHLTTVIGELAQRDRDQPSPTSGLLTAITPDVRVSVQAADGALGSANRRRRPHGRSNRQQPETSAVYDIKVADLPMRLLVTPDQLTATGALRMEHAQAIANLLVVEGGLALVPSDTCYSLAAVPSGAKMSRRINDILARREEPISLAFDGLPRAQVWGKLSLTAIRLIESLTPGPLTVVCPLTQEIGPHIAADVLAAPDQTLGIRIPDSRIETQLVAVCDSPITTVAVRTQDQQRTPVTDFTQALQIVREGLSRIVGAPQLAAVEANVPFATTHSTVVRVPGRSTPYEVVRPGAISEKQLQAAADRVSQWETAEWT